MTFQPLFIWNSLCRIFFFFRSFVTLTLWSNVLSNVPHSGSDCLTRQLAKSAAHIHTHTHVHNSILSWFPKIYTLGDFTRKNNFFFEKSPTLDSFAKKRNPEHVVTLAVFPPGYRQQGPRCSGALPESLRSVTWQGPPCPINDRHGQDPAGGQRIHAHQRLLLLGDPRNYWCFMTLQSR